MRYTPAFRAIWMDDGPEVTALTFLWRSVPHSVANLNIPSNFPAVSAYTSEVVSTGKGRH